MRSHHFSMLRAGLVIIWPWLFRRSIFLEINSFVIYPFVFLSPRMSKDLRETDLADMTILIFVKQQEELFQATMVLLIPTIIVFGWWGLIPLLFAPGILLAMMIESYWRRRKAFLYYTTAFKFAFMLSDIPFYTEAYANCNYLEYFHKRKIFAWRKYMYH